MAVTRKPKTQPEPPAVDVDALIRKGGSVAGEAEATQAAKTVSVILRIPSDIAAQVDAAVGSRRVKTPRHTWLLEAIHEKLDRESEGYQ